MPFNPVPKGFELIFNLMIDKNTNRITLFEYTGGVA